MKVAAYVTGLLLVLAFAGAGWLFWVQNSAQKVVPSFELWGLGRYGAPLTLSELMALCAAVGLVVGFTAGAVALAALKNRRIRSLEEQLRVGRAEPR